MTTIRDERAEDEAAIGRVVAEAFAAAEHHSGDEARIVATLRREGALAVSLVACVCGEIVGHVAASPVTIPRTEGGWFGLGPVAVLPDMQRRGIGAALIRTGLDRLRAAGAKGCVVLGDPHYYARFGFEHDPRLRYADVPGPYFQRLSFGSESPEGEVRYHPAFGGA